MLAETHYITDIAGIGCSSKEKPWSRDTQQERKAAEKITRNKISTSQKSMDTIIFVASRNDVVEIADGEPERGLSIYFVFVCFSTLV